MSFEAKAFVCLVVTAGMVVLGYGMAHPASKNIAEFICYLLVAFLASTLSVNLPEVADTMSANFVLVLVGILELSFTETLALGSVGSSYADISPRPQTSPNFGGQPLHQRVRDCVVLQLLSLGIHSKTFRQFGALAASGSVGLFPGQYRSSCNRQRGAGKKISAERFGWIAIRGRSPTTW